MQLAVYDLSRGMASQLSGQILGQTIDGIWHTGIRVFSKEFYFGGGIQVSPIGFFERNSGMQPTRIQVMGRTPNTDTELRTFIASISSQWTGNSYNLLSHNCNNFSDTVCSFLLQRGIPEEIVGLPERVFATPMGMMIRPMIESMQRSIQADSSHSFDPFGGSFLHGGQTTSSGPFPTMPAANYGSSFERNGAALGYSADSASISHTHAPARVVQASQQITVVRAKLDDTFFVSAQVDGSEGMIARLCKLKSKAKAAAGSAVSASAEATPSSPKGSFGACSYCKRSDFGTQFAFDCHERDKPCKTLLSGAAAAAGPSSPTEKDANGSEGMLLLTAADQQELARLSLWIKDQSSSFPETAYETLTALATTLPAAQTPALFLLRVLVAGDANLKLGKEGYTQQITQHMMRLTRQLARGSSSCAAALGSISATVMSLCTLSNWVSSVPSLLVMFDPRGASANAGEDALDEIIDVAVTYMAHDRVELRQIGAALAYNIVLHNTRSDKVSAAWGGIDIGNGEVETAELHAHVVQLLCCSLEGIVSETDSTVRKRRLAIVLRTLRAHGSIATSFVRDLGFETAFPTMLAQLRAARGSSSASAVDSEEAILLDLIHSTRLMATAAELSTPLVRGIPIS